MVKKDGMILEKQHSRAAVTSLALLERARAWEWVKDPLFARGGQGSRKNIRYEHRRKKSRFYASLQGI